MGICGSTNENKPKNGEKPTRSDTPEPRIIKSDKPDTANHLKSTRKSILNPNEILVNNSNVVTLSTGTPLDNYVADKQLGEGSYGVVHRVKHKDINVYRAMKKIINSSKEKDKVDEIINEIELLKTMDHPSIVKIFEFYNTKDGFYLITEYCNGGELFDRILKAKRFDETAAAYIMYQVLAAVFYCHGMNIIHRDLKPENILIDSEEKDGFLNIKVVDFGTAKIFDKNKSESKVIGSAYYIAPEVLNSKYNEKCDIWSCGVIMYILLCGRPPFGGEDDEIVEKIKRGKFDLKAEPWPGISAEAKDLIKSMLDLNYLSRLSAQKALSHKWFKKHKMRERFTNVGLDKLAQSIENIKKYKTDSKLQQAAMAFLVHNSLYLPEVKDLLKVFKNIDTNGDGRITKEEMCIAMSKHYNIPDPEEEVNEIFLNVDNDNNGYIEYEEYIRASISKKNLLTDEILKFTFKFFDKDGSGSITADEVAKVLFQGQGKEISKKLAEELINEVDLDKNSQINFEEFKLMMIKLLDK